MNIYKDKNRKNARVNAYTEKADTKNIDMVEYTNMSSYERYLRNKETNDKRDNSYSNNNSRPHVQGQYDDRYEYQERYDDRSSRYDDRYDSRPPQYYEQRRDYYYENRDPRRDDFNNYPDYRDEGYDLRRQNSTQRGRKQKKGGLTLKAKLMIGVYFILVAFIAVLIIINAIPGAKADSTVKMPETVSYEESVLYKTENGDKVDLVDGVLDKDGNPTINWQN